MYQVTVETVAKHLRQSALILVWKDGSAILAAALTAIRAHFKAQTGYDFNPQLVTVDDSSLGLLLRTVM